MAVSIQDSDFYRNESSRSLHLFLQVEDVSTNLHFLIVDCTDEERMAREIQFLVSDDKVDIPIKTGTGKPAGVVRIAGICLHCNLIDFAKLEQLAHIYIKAKVTIVSTSYSLTIEVNIAHEHDALEIKEYALALPLGLRSQFIPIPAYTHFLKATWTQTAANITTCITIIRTFAGIRSHPVLSDQEIVRQVDYLIISLQILQHIHVGNIPTVELPTSVERNRISD